MRETWVDVNRVLSKDDSRILGVVEIGLLRVWKREKVNR